MGSTPTVVGKPTIPYVSDCKAAEKAATQVVPGDIEWPVRSLDALRQLAQGAIIATVTSVEAARYNSLDGQCHEPTYDQLMRGGVTMPGLYRIAHVRIDRVLFASSDLSARFSASPADLSIYLTGNGKPAGVRIFSNDDRSRPDIFENNIDGPWLPGSEMILMLRVAPWHFTEGPKDELQSVSGFETEWTRSPDGTVAVNALAGKDQNWQQLVDWLSGKS